jgi:integrase
MKGSFNVHKLSAPHGSSYWKVDGYINSKRVRTFYRTKEEAEEAASIKNIELQNHGHQHAQIPSYLRIQALHCNDLLEPLGVSLSTAVEYYLAHHDIRSKSLPVAQACQRFITDSSRRLENGEIGQRHHEHLVKSLRKFNAEFAQRQICDLSSNDIETWLNCLPLAAESKNSHRRSIYRLFWQAKKWGLVKENPVTEIEILTDRRVKAKLPGILSLEQAAKLLETAPQSVLPVVAIGLFAGLRSSEINQLRWEDVRWEKRVIDCSAKITKTASRRLVEMSDNLLEWLAPYRNATGKIFQYGCAQQIREVTAAGRASGIAKWPQNALRHSFGSNHLAMYENAPKTALQMGHENGETKTLLAHYTNARTKEEAKAYWNIRPSGAQNITSIAA